MKRSRSEPAPLAPIPKNRAILFSKFPPGQVPEAADALHRHDDIDVHPNIEQRRIDVLYDLRAHTLEELETELEDKGFHLDNTLLNKLIRAFVHYAEETELHNLDAPERPRKKSQNTAYTQAWERQLHGDHDDTPPEWREYK